MVPTKSNIIVRDLITMRKRLSSMQLDSMLKKEALRVWTEGCDGTT